MIRFIHSLSTRPFSILLYNRDMQQNTINNIWYYSLSVAYLKKLNLKVVLYTDEFGASLLGHLPYDEIHIVEIPNEVSPRFWASAKMWALGEEPIDSIHIDGDVFIKKQSLVDDLKNSNYDVVVLNFEHGDWYKKDAGILWKESNYCKELGLILDNLGAYNTGIFGFKNLELKDKFVNGYKNMVHHYSKLYPEELLNSNNITPDVVLELLYIYQLSKDYDTKTLLNSKLPSKEFCQLANDIGYQHVLTNKSRDVLIALKVLKKISPEIYEKTYISCQNLLNKLK